MHYQYKKCQTYSKEKHNILIRNDNNAEISTLLNTISKYC